MSKKRKVEEDDESEIKLTKKAQLEKDIWDEVARNFLKKLCQSPNCTLGAVRGGIKGFCKAHGGGRRCITPKCTTPAQGSVPYCYAHGGGRRCKYKDCKSFPLNDGVKKGFCRYHGGGMDCPVPGCKSGVQWGTKLCAKHRNYVVDSSFSSSSKKKNIIKKNTAATAATAATTATAAFVSGPASVFLCQPIKPPKKTVHHTKKIYV